MSTTSATTECVRSNVNCVKGYALVLIIFTGMCQALYISAGSSWLFSRYHFLLKIQFRQSHSCPSLCSANGTCEIETAPQSIEATFTGRHETFQYTKVNHCFILSWRPRTDIIIPIIVLPRWRSSSAFFNISLLIFTVSHLVAKRLQCVIPIPGGEQEHTGPHSHSLDPSPFHFCESRLVVLSGLGRVTVFIISLHSCGSCGYICTLPRGWISLFLVCRSSLTYLRRTFPARARDTSWVHVKNALGSRRSGWYYIGVEWPQIFFGGRRCAHDVQSDLPRHGKACPPGVLSKSRKWPLRGPRAGTHLNAYHAFSRAPKRLGVSQLTLEAFRYICLLNLIFLIAQLLAVYLGFKGMPKSLSPIMFNL